MDHLIQRRNKKNVKFYNKYMIDFIDNNGVDDSNTNNKLIMLNKVVPDILKNDSSSKKVKVNTPSDVIFLDERVFSNLKSEKNEETR